jgi:NTP pyrophosphatase (non-canonical NTP hydrolase)
MVPLTHEYAGQTYLLCEIEEVIELLEIMREDGVVFPGHVLTTLREEALER